jgi:hypothetical protein
MLLLKKTLRTKIPTMMTTTNAAAFKWGFEGEDVQHNP